MREICTILDLDFDLDLVFPENLDKTDAQKCGSSLASLRLKEIFAYGIRNSALGIRNLANDWNPESTFH